MKTKISLLFFCLPLTVFGQRKLSLDDALQLAIENNYGIKLAKIDSSISALNANYGNAGFLPQISFNGGTSAANNQINQEFSNGLTVKKNNVGSSAINAGIALNWTLFDGFKMFATLEKLRELKSMGELKVKQAMEETTAAVRSAYYNCALQAARIKVTETFISLFEERVNLATLRQDIGNGNRSDLLQAKVDLNEQKINLMRETQILENQYGILKNLLGLDANGDVRVTDTIPGAPSAWKALLAETENHSFSNPVLQLFQKNITVADLGLKESRSQLFPRISLVTNYTFTRNESQAGFALLNQNQGLNAGLNFTYTLFNGGAVRRNISTAKYAVYMNNFAFQQEKERQEMQFYQLRKNLQFQTGVYSLLEESEKWASENVHIVMEKFKLGMATSLELKDAQNAALNTALQKLNAACEAMKNMAEIRRLQGII